MRKTKKARSRIKKVVKEIILIFGIQVIMILITIYIANKYQLNYQIKNNLKQEINHQILDTNKEDNNEYIYKEGFTEQILDNLIINRIQGKSFPKEFNSKYTKILYTDLRYLKVKYVDFSGIKHNDGELIVNKKVSREVLKIFYELYINNYPIEKIKLVDEYDAIDELSMEDNNTSSFNYRINETEDKLSWHCFGLAIDINPLYNPYIIGDKTYPSTAKKYIDREQYYEGKIDHSDLAYIIFTKYGWKWGGDFINTKDYQHFYKEIYDDEIRKRKE